jgi:hypothetical protein
MINSIQCAQCVTFDIREKAIYHGKGGVLLGEWPLYYFGAKPSEPEKAEVYFCGVYCANQYHKEKRDAQKGTDE